jgi:cell division protein FtsB
MPMGFKFQHTSNFTKLVIIGEFILVSYLLYILMASVYKSYQIDVHIRTFEADNARIEDENRLKSEEFDYFSSDAYVEKIAKQNLGLVNPGEEVIIIPKNNLKTTGIVGDADISIDTSNIQINKPQRWWKFFFDIKR